MGPGLLYAAAAVGVSHLVQSTRAGADFSFDLIPFLIIAMVIKYPFFEFAPRYTNATGKDLITAYREMGTWAVALFALITLFTMFAIVAAVVMVTAGVAGFVFNMGLNPVYISALLMFVSALVLIVGRYHLLDRVIKYVIAVLALSTIFAVISAFGTHAETQAFFTNFSFSEKPHIFFLIAFIGWMPSPIDVSVWHSLWSKAKGKEGK
ncbi:MAG: divalent metal cation transporter [Bacteroidales bacterium]|nr:divalent metal cation transporter [Bacteroidales bacterium]